MFVCESSTINHAAPRRAAESTGVDASLLCILDDRVVCGAAGRIVYLQGAGVSPHTRWQPEVLIWPPQWTTKNSKSKTAVSQMTRSN